MLSEVFVLKPLINQIVVAALELLTSVTQSQETFQCSEKRVFFFPNLSLKTVKYILQRIYNEENGAISVHDFF